MNWVIAGVLVLLLSLLFRMGLLTYGIYVLFGIALGSRWLSRVWSANVSATRRCDKLRAEVGETANVIVTVRNAGRLPVAWVLVEDLLPRGALVHDPPNLQVRGRRVMLAMLRGESEKELTYQLTCHRRGYYQIGPLVLETGDLFGLHRRYRVLSEPQFLMVYPKVVPLAGYEIASKRPIGEVRMTYRLYEDPTRIAGVRQYLPGDPLSRVHWKATATTGTLHSKVFEPSTIAGATVLLDFHQSTHPAHHEPFRSELNIVAAASLANAVYQMGQQIGLVTNGRDAADRIRQEGWDYDLRTRDTARRSAAMAEQNTRLAPLVVETQRGVDQFQRILDTLARLELTDGLTFPQLISEASSRLPRDATVIAMLTTVTPDIAIAIGNLRRRGFAVTAILSVYDENEFAAQAGLLLAEGIDTHQLKDEQSIMTLCRNQILR